MIKCITDSATVRLINSTTIEITYFDDVTVESDGIFELIWVIDQISKGRQLKHLVVVNEFTQFSLEAKKTLAIENSKRKNKILSEAIVVRSLANRIIESYYIQQIKDCHKVKLFNNILEAKKWLEETDKETLKVNVLINNF